MSARAASTSTGTSSVATNQIAALPKPIASRVLVNEIAGGQVGSTTGETYRCDHLCLANCDNISIAYSNSFNGGGGLPANTIYVRAAIEDAAGILHRVTFNGQAEIALVPMATVFSDPVGIGYSAGGRFRTRTFVRVANVGEQVPRAYLTKNSPYVDGFASDDQTTVSSPTWSTDGGFHFGPAGVFAEFTDATCVIAALGDSITAGQNDATANADKQGWLMRALNNQYPYINLAAPADTAAGFKPPSTGATSRKPRVLLMGGCNYAVVLYGTNDLGTGQNVAQLQGGLVAVWRASALRGQKVIGCTIPPSTTSSDGFTTLGNQTVAASNSVRTGFNDWLRASAPVDPTTGVAVAIGTSGALTVGQTGHPLWAYWELADTVESARNSGKWRVDQGAITDGTHPNAAGAALMAAGADLTKLGSIAPGAPTPPPATVNTPTTTLGANLFREWDIADITGKADGDAVSSWSPHSTGGALQQGTGGRQPLYKTNINNGLAAVRFDGVDDFLLTLENAGQGTINRWASPFNPWEIWMVMKKRSTAAPPAGAVGFIAMDDAGTNQVQTGAGALPQAITLSAGSNLATVNISDLSTGFHLWRFSANGATSSIDEDGTNKAAGNAGTTVLRALLVGANTVAAGAMDIDVQHILVVNRVTTAGEQSALRSWAQNVYATP